MSSPFAKSRRAMAPVPLFGTSTTAKLRDAADSVPFDAAGPSAELARDSCKCAAASLLRMRRARLLTIFFVTSGKSGSNLSVNVGASASGSSCSSVKERVTHSQEGVTDVSPLRATVTKPAGTPAVTPAGTVLKVKQPNQERHDAE
eukprot:3644719-Prymnesium_polylepis.1